MTEVKFSPKVLKYIRDAFHRSDSDYTSIQIADIKTDVFAAFLKEGLGPFLINNHEKNDGSIQGMIRAGNSVLVTLDAAKKMTEHTHSEECNHEGLPTQHAKQMLGDNMAFSSSIDTNIDFSLTGIHNVKPIKLTADQIPNPIPTALTSDCFTDEMRKTHRSMDRLNLIPINNMPGLDLPVSPAPCRQSIEEQSMSKMRKEAALFVNLVNKPAHEVILERILNAGGTYFANHNIAQYIEEGELDLLQAELTEAMEKVQDILLIDRHNDHNSQGTAKRVAKMYLREVFKGRYTEAPPVTSFPNVTHLDELYVVGPITIRSACSHHMVPITGQAWIGVKPSNRVIGLSKFNRLSDWIMSRLQIQEEAVQQLADIIEKEIQPLGLGVIIKADHMCMSWRGVRDNDTQMTTSVMRGEMRDNPSLKNEFLQFIAGHGFK